MATMELYLLCSTRTNLFFPEIRKSYLPGGLNLDMSCSDGVELKGDGENVRENDFDHAMIRMVIEMIDAQR